MLWVEEHSNARKCVGENFLSVSNLWSKSFHNILCIMQINFAKSTSIIFQDVPSCSLLKFRYMQLYLFYGCFYLFYSFQPHLSYFLGTSPAILGLLYLPKYGQIFNKCLLEEGYWVEIEKISASCLFQFTRHCSYHSHSIIKCLHPVGHFDSKYVEHSKPNSYNNYSIATQVCSKFMS